MLENEKLEECFDINASKWYLVKLQNEVIEQISLLTVGERGEATAEV